MSLPVWLYFALSESGPRQATLDKRLLSMQVQGLGGERIGFGRALLRPVVKLLPWELTHFTLLVPLPLWWDPQPGLRPGLWVVYGLIGVYLLALFLTPRRQSVDDLIARTVATKKVKRP